jgi:hypothetical protein
VAFDDVIAQNYANRIVRGEVFYQRQGLRDAAFAFLVGVVKMFKAKRFSISQ